MAEDNDSQKSGGLKSLMGELPLDNLKGAAQDGLKALGDKAKDSVTGKLSDLTDSLTNVADGGGVIGTAGKEGAKAAAQGDNPVGGALKGGFGKVKDKVKSALPGGGGGGGGKATKSTNIIETIDVGVPIDVAYNQWTQFQDFSGFMKKVENVEHDQDEAKVTFKAQVFWSHRTWEGKIIEMVPNERIIWKSKGQKGHVDGAVTFHELAPSLTRILVVLEYYPQGLFEKTGNIWEAQGRRARAELRHFRRHVMTRSILDEDELEGWRGEIRDGEIVRDHDEVVEEEEQENEEGDEGEDEDAYDDEGESEEGESEEDDEESDDEEPEDEYEEPEDEDVDEEESEEEYDEPEDEVDDEPEDEESEDEPEDEEPEDEFEEADEEEADEDEESEDDVEEEDAEEEEPEDEFEEADEEEADEDEEPEDEEVAEEDERGGRGRRARGGRRRRARGDTPKEVLSQTFRPAKEKVNR